MLVRVGFKLRSANFPSQWCQGPEKFIEANHWADLEEEWGDDIITGDKWIEIIYSGV